MALKGKLLAVIFDAKTNAIISQNTSTLNNQFQVQSNYYECSTSKRSQTVGRQFFFIFCI